MTAKYRLTENYVWYGERRLPFTLLADSDPEEAAIPKTISSAADLDLEAIGNELNHTVFNRGRRYRPSRCSAAEAWQLEISETTPEQAKALTDDMRANPKLAHLPAFMPQIYVAGNGISLRYILDSE